MCQVLQLLAVPLSAMPSLLLLFKSMAAYGSCLGSLWQAIPAIGRASQLGAIFIAQRWGYAWTLGIWQCNRSAWEGLELLPQPQGPTSVCQGLIQAK